MIEIAIAFAAAEAAVAGVKRAIALGHEVQDCYHDIATFFEKSGEIQAAAVEQKHEQKMGRAKPISHGEATKQALDATFAARKLFKMEVELREMLVYNSGGETGLYEEMCQRRDAIIQEAKERVEEEARQERMRIAAIKRKKAERIQMLQNILTIICGTAVAAGIIYGIWWMFNWRE